MRRNVEVKARLRALAAARGAAERLGGAARAQGQGLVQADTFFRVPRGRLKLRRTPDGRGELIFYERPDTAGPKLSHFTITPTDDPDGLEAVLTQALGVLGVVRKERLLYLVGQTRVHLDSVEGLGDFVELEVVLTEEQTVEDGERVAHQLMKELGIEEEDLISGAYLDLLLAKGDSSS
uniref:CYTH domain-containing protein n=1 Tax=Falco tinnunculus TaxID=100819 RepID=A0A8C4V287_FALTI